MDHGWLPVKVPMTADPYADWHPEREIYSRFGAHVLSLATALEAHIGGPLTASRLQMLAAMKGAALPDGGFCYEAAAIRKLKGAPSRGCPAHIRDRLMVQLFLIWPSELPVPQTPNPSKEAA